MCKFPSVFPLLSRINFAAFRSQVWRQVAARTPGLWCHIDLLWPFDIQRLSLERAGSLSLKITCLKASTFLRTAPPPFLRDLVARADDMHVLDYMFSAEENASLTAPRLKKLRLSMRQAGGLSGQSQLLRCLVEPITDLEDIQSDDIASLTSFILTNPHIRVFTATAGSKAPSKWSSMLEACSNLDNLTEVTLTDCKFPTSALSQTFVLPHVELLCLTNDDGDVVVNNFAHLVLPSLQHLSFQVGKWQQSTWMNMMSILPWRDDLCAISLKSWDEIEFRFFSVNQSHQKTFNVLFNDNHSPGHEFWPILCLSHKGLRLMPSTVFGVTLDLRRNSSDLLDDDGFNRLLDCFAPLREFPATPNSDPIPLTAQQVNDRVLNEGTLYVLIIFSGVVPITPRAHTLHLIGNWALKTPSVYDSILHRG